MPKFNHDRFRKTVRGEITQQELAAKLGLKQQQISALLKRGEQMKVSQFLAICEAIKINPSQFLQ